MPVNIVVTNSDPENADVIIEQDNGDGTYTRLTRLIGGTCYGVTVDSPIRTRLAVDGD